MHDILRADALVVGAGVVGLAVARLLARRGLETIVLEAEPGIGSGVSSRNSGVIHAGIYYPPGSAKALHCVRGRELLYAYCETRAIAHRRCGKLIVATDDSQIPALRALADGARANGVTNLELLDARQARALEPALECVCALHSPSTGIVDAHEFAQALQADVESAGGMVALRSVVVGGTVTPEGIRLQVAAEAPFELLARRVVNAAGLGAQSLAQAIEGMPRRLIPPLHLAKGQYFGCRARVPFSRLIYPMPEPGGLGVHLTLDLAGRGRFGPDVQWVDRIDYEVEAARVEAFYGSVRRYWPGLPAGALAPDYAGIRPKISGPGTPAGDFVLQGPREHGIEGLIHLFGIESPGLTAALSLAEAVVERLEGG